VNGIIDKCDGNILGDFFFQRVGNTNLFIGSYPMDDFDFQRLGEAGVNGILNLQTS